MATETHERLILKAEAVPVARLSLLTHLSEVDTVALQVRMRGMRLSELPSSHLQKVQAESQYAPRSSMWVLPTSGSHFLPKTQKRHLLSLWLGDFN